MIGAHLNSKGEFTVRRNETPLKRLNPSGEEVWIARYTTRDGKRRSAGTFAKRGACKRPAADGACCAQHRIWWAYEQDTAAPQTRGTIREYAGRWLEQHPRSERSNDAHEVRLRAVLDADLGAGPFGDMLFADVDRSHAVRLREILLVDQGRAARGAKAIISTVAAMWADALDDGWTRTGSPFAQLRVRASDPRVRKPARAPRVLSWAEMHAICAAAGPHEASLRVLSDCGLRLGEMLPLRRVDVKLGAGRCDEHPTCLADGPHLHVRRKAWHGQAYPGTKTGLRVAPLPAELAALLGRVTPLDPFGLMFPGAGGVWWETDWRERVWGPACARAGVRARPHDFRHSWVSRMRAAGIDAVDVAAAAGHSVETATRVYTHPLGQSHERMREAVGS